MRWSCFFAWPALIKRPWQNCLLPRNEKGCSYPEKLCSGFKSPKKFPWDDKSFFRIVSRIVPFVILNSRNMFDEPNSSGIDWWGGGLLSSCPIKNQWNCRLFNILTCLIKSYKRFSSKNILKGFSKPIKIPTRPNSVLKLVLKQILKLVLKLGLNYYPVNRVCKGLAL